MVEGPYALQTPEAGTDAAQLGSDTQSTASNLYSDAYGLTHSQTAATDTGTGFQGDPGIVADTNFSGDPGMVTETTFNGDPGIVANPTDSSTTTSTDGTTGSVTDGTTGTVTDGTTGTVTDGTTGTVTDGTTATDTSAVTPDVAQAYQAATQEFVRRMLDDPSFMFAMKSASDNMSQQSFNSFLGFALQDAGAYPTAGDQEILLDAANKAVNAGVPVQEFSSLQPYIAQPYLTDTSQVDTGTAGTYDPTAGSYDTTTGSYDTTTGSYDTTGGSYDTTGGVTTDTTGMSTDVTGTATDVSGQYPTDTTAYDPSATTDTSASADTTVVPQAGMTDPTAVASGY